MADKQNPDPFAPEEQGQNALDAHEQELSNLITAAKAPLTPGNAPTIEVTDIDNFVLLLTAWHQREVNILNHLMKAPDGLIIALSSANTEEEATAKLESGETQPLTLEGETMRAFKAGLAMALSALGQLPFLVTEVEPVEPSKDSTVVANGSNTIN